MDQLLQRASLITGNPRSASDPLNAILNYLYAILEAESRVALLAVGLDPGLGILHTDQRARDSLALDLMETVRPHVDKFALDLAATRVFGLADLHETQTGQCRLLPRLARELATTAPAWTSHVAPHAEMIARTLADDAGIARSPTLLTGGTRRQSRPASNHTRPPKPATPIIRTTSCAECGTTILGGQKRCTECHATANAERLRRQQADEAARRRSAGEHPSQGQHVRDRISKTQRSQWATRKATDPPSGFTGQPSEFRRLILPRLAGLQPRELARRTGLSAGYCAQIRDGKRVPDLRHWAAFHLAGSNAKQSGAESH